LPPFERPVLKRRHSAGGVARWSPSDQPQRPEAHWLNEFIQREADDEAGAFPGLGGPADEPAKKSYTGRVLVGIGLLLAAGIGGVAAYRHFAVPPRPRPAVPAAVVLHVPKPAPPLSQPHEQIAPAPPPPAGDGDVAVSGFPQQPVVSPPKVFNDWANALIIPRSPIDQPEVAPPAERHAHHEAAATPHVPPAAAVAPVIVAVTPAPVARPSVSIPTPVAPIPAPPAPVVELPVVAGPAPATPKPRAPAATEPAAPAVATLTPEAPDTLPTGTGLHLRIVYVPTDAAEGSRLAALAGQLRSEVSDITSAMTSAGPVSGSGVVYFFSNDRAEAGRIADSLSRLTKRTEPVMMVHREPLPRPGTVEIRIPLKEGKVLRNEGL
jgi:hypothetical protein